MQLAEHSKGAGADRAGNGEHKAAEQNFSCQSLSSKL